MSIKKCNKCGLEKDVSEFNKSTENKDGLNRWCRSCQSIAHQQRLNKLIYIEIETKTCGKCGQEKNITEFYRYKYNPDGHQAWCKECYIQFKKELYIKNTEQIKNQHIKWQTNNPEKYKQSMENYRKSEEGRIADRLQHKKKREKMNQLPKTFTEEEWQGCLEYFENSCSYCGSKDKIQQDHFVSIFNDGAYAKNNIVAACGFCNPSKGDNNFFDWYPKQEFYSKEREDKILNYLNAK